MRQAERSKQSGNVEGGVAVASPGHAAFAAILIGLGLLGLVRGDFTPTWDGVRESFPGREALAYLCAVVSLATGVGMLWRRTTALAARTLLCYVLLWFLAFRLPALLRAPTGLGPWWACGDTAVMAAAAWIVYAWSAGEPERRRLPFVTGDRGVRLARMLYGLAMIPFGVAHFLNLQGTASLVPAWVPWHVACATATGGAFVAAGVAVLLGLWARLAAVLSAWQMALFTLLVWLPIVLAGPDAFQWSEFVGSCALTAGAWVVADSYRGMPWFALGKR